MEETQVQRDRLDFRGPTASRSQSRNPIKTLTDPRTPAPAFQSLPGPHAERRCPSPANPVFPSRCSQPAGARGLNTTAPRGWAGGRISPSQLIYSLICFPYFQTESGRSRQGKSILSSAIHLHSDHVPPRSPWRFPPSLLLVGSWMLTDRILGGSHATLAD